MTSIDQIVADMLADYQTAFDRLADHDPVAECPECGQDIPATVERDS